MIPPDANAAFVATMEDPPHKDASTGAASALQAVVSRSGNLLPRAVTLTGRRAAKWLKIQGKQR